MKYVSVQIGNYTILQKKKKKKETKNRMKKKNCMTFVLLFMFLEGLIN